MEDVNTRILAFGPVRFALDLNLPDQRGDGLDGIRNGEKSHERQARIRQPRVNALADGPDLGFAGQGCKGLDGKIGHHVVELADQPLVGTEHDGADRLRIGLSFPFHDQGRWLALPESRRSIPAPRCDSSRPAHAPISRIARCSTRPGPSSCGRRMEISGAVDLAAQARRGVAHDFSFESAFGWKRRERFACDLDDRLPVLVAQFCGCFKSRAHFGRDVRRSLAHGVPRHPASARAALGRRVRRSMPAGWRSARARRPGQFRLLEAGADSPSMLDDLAGVFIQARAEPGKGLEFLELRVGELEIARHGAVGRALRLAADARNGFADIDGGQHAQFKQRRREIDLPVRDGDQVGRNVGGNILRFGLDDGQGGERAAAEFLAQMGGAFEQARVDVEDVAGKGFAPGRPAEQEGELAIGSGVLREVVVNDQHIAPGFHEMLRDAGGGVRGDVGEPGRVVALGDDHDGVFHRAFLAKVGHGLGHGGSALADGAIDAEDILAALVENGVDGDGGFARLPVAQDQLALAAPDGNKRIDDLEAGLQRHGDGRAIHDGRGGAFDGQARAWRSPARCHRAGGRAGR